MRNIVLIILVLIWILCLIILIIGLTNLVSNSIFKDYRLVVGIGFILVSGLLKTIWSKFSK